VNLLHDVWIAILCYGLGCFTSGYYLVRWKTGRDIRREGSGSTGGRNVGRVLGKRAFALTAALDFAKGLAAVGLARLLGASPNGELLALLAVVGGHIWPAQLRFRGGKGVATAGGGLALLNPWLFVAMLTLFVVLYLGRRRFVESGLLTLSLAPLGLWLISRLDSALLQRIHLANPDPVVIGLVLLAAIILIAHRKNIRDIIAGTRRYA
jgi:glycerol-3-phosphate acyltransferase PlsY